MDLEEQALAEQIKKDRFTSANVNSSLFTAIEGHTFSEKFCYLPEKECLKETIKKPTLLNLQWDLCVKNEDESSDEHVYTMFGDSGGILINLPCISLVGIC